MTKETREEVKALKGVYICRDRSGRDTLAASISVNGKSIHLGYYKEPRRAAKAYDMYVIVNNIDRKTNFLKKKTD